MSFILLNTSYCLHGIYRCPPGWSVRTDVASTLSFVQKVSPVEPTGFTARPAARQTLQVQCHIPFRLRKLFLLLCWLY